MATFFSMAPSTRNKEIIRRNDVLQTLGAIDGDEKAQQDYAINKNKIALINAEQIQQISVTGKSLLTHSAGKQESISQYTKNEKIIPFYEDFTKNALNFLTGKSSTSKWIMDSSVKLNNTLHYNMNKVRSNSSFDEVKSGYNGFKDFVAGKKNMFVLDLEALSGQNKFGQQDIDQLTEYAMRKYDNTGKVLEEHTGVIGIDDTTAKKYSKVAESFMTDGYEEQKDKVALEYFAKLGHEDTSVVRDDNHPGMWKVEKYTAEDAKDIMTKENILNGIELSKKIGLDQQKNLVNGKMAWMNDFVSAMNNIQEETSNGTSILAGQNAKEYDIRQINKLGARYGWNSYHINSDSFFDSLPLLQHASADPDFVAKLYEGKQDLLHGATPLQQTSLVKNFLGDKHFEETGMGAHSALSDVQNFFDLMTQAKVGDQGLVDYAYNTAAAQYQNQIAGDIVGGGQQLFYAKNDSNRKGKIIDFTIDKFTGNIHTKDGVIIGKDGKAKESFAESVIKKGASYTVQSINPVQMNQDYIKRMQEVYPNMAVSDMAVMHLTPFIDPSVQNADIIQKASLDIYRIGSLDDLQTAFSNDMVLYGNQVNGKYQMVPEAQEAMQRFDITNGESGSLEIVPKPTTIESIVKDSTETLLNDTAARKMREYGYKQYSNYVSLIDEINGAIGDVSPEQYGAKKKEVLQAMVEQSTAIAQGAPLDIKSQSIQLRSLQELIGYKDFKTGKQTVYRNTVDNFLAGLEHVESIQDDVKVLLDKVNGVTKGTNNKDYRDFVFKQGLDALRSKAVEKQKSDPSYKTGYVRGFNKDYFDVDISSITKKANYSKINKAVEDINPDNILTVNLNAGGEYDLINKIKAASGVKNVSYNQEVEAKKRLTMFADVLNKQGYISDEFVDDISKSDYHPTILAQQIISQLKQTKKENPAAGIIKPNSVHSVLGPSGLSNGSGGIFNKNELDDIFSFLDNEEYSYENFHQLKPGDDAAAVKTRQSIADKLVDQYFIDKGPGNKVLKEQYGYNDDEIHKLNILVETHKNDSKKMVNKMLDAASSVGGQVYSDPFYDKFGMIFGDKFYDMSFMPKLKFKDGMFYTQVGKTAASANLRFSYNSRDSAIGLKSAIGESLDDSYNWERILDNAKLRREDPAEAFFFQLKSFSNKVRSGSESVFSSSSVSKFDEQDVKSQFEVNYKNIVDHLPELKKKGLFDSTEFFDQKKFFKTLEKSKYSFNTLNDTSRELLVRNISNIFEAIKSNKRGSLDQDVIDILEDANYNAKGTAFEKGRIRIDNIHYGFDPFINGARGITEQSRFIPFSKNRTQTALEKVGLAKEIHLGNPLLTRVGHGIAERHLPGLDKNDISVTELLASRTIMTSDMMGQKIAKLKAEKNIDSARRNAIDVLSNTHVAEGGAIADARIADNIFTSYDIQKISFKKELADLQDGNIEVIKKMQEYSKVLPKINIANDGKIFFTYETGKLVKRNDDILKVNGYGSEEVIEAKSDGVLNFGFFEKGKGVLVKEENVSTAVEDYAKKHNRKIGDIDEFMTVAQNIFDASYYVDDLHAKTFRKVVENRSEKHMTSFAYMGIGRSEQGVKNSEKKISAVLKEIGLESYTGQVLSKNVFDQFKTSDIKNTILNQMSKKDITQDAYETAIKKVYGDKATVEDFYTSISKERFLASDLLKEVTGSRFALQDEHLKHKTRIAGIQSGLYEMYMNRINNGMTGEKASNEIIEKVGKHIKGDNGKPGLTVNKNGDFEIANMSMEHGGDIDYDGISSAISKDIGKEKWDTMFEPGSKTYSAFGVVNNWSGMSVNKAKIARREFDILKFDRYNKEDLTIVKKRMKNDALFSSIYGHVASINDAGDISDVKNRSVLQSYTNQLRLQAANTPESKKLLNAYSSGSAAINYNANGTFKDRVEKSGFNKVNLTDISVPTGGDADYIDRENMIVNLKDGIITDEILGKTNLKNKTQIAIAGHIPSVNGKEPVLPEYQKSLNALVRTRNELETEMNRGKNRDINHIEQLKENFVSTVNNLNQQQSGYFSGNGENSVWKRMNMLVMDKSIMGQVTVVDPRSGSKMLEVAQFGGKSLAEHAKNGVYINASFRSKDAFKEMGFFDEDYLKGVFSNKEKYSNLYKKDGSFVTEEAEKMMESKLSRQGVAGFVHRFPSIYRESIMSAQLYLDKDLTGSKVVDTIHNAIYQHKDVDGDNSEAIVARFYGKDGKLKDQLENPNLEGFKDINAQIYTHAYVNNQSVQAKLEKDTAEERELFADKERNYNRELAMAGVESPNGHMTPRPDRMIPKSKMKQFGEGSREATMALDETVTGLAGVKRAAAGEINLPNFAIRKWKEMAQEPLHITEKENDAIDALLEAGEEGFLSPKHGSKEIVENSDVLEKYNKAIRATINGDEDSKKLLTQWMQDNAKDRIRADIYNRHDMSKDEFIDTSVNVIHRIYGNMNNMHQYDSYMAAGTRSSGVNPKKIYETLDTPAEDESIEADNARRVRETFNERHEQSNLYSKIKVASEENRKAVENEAVEQSNRIYMGRKRMTNFTEGVTARIADAIKNSGLSARKLALGSVGLAGAIMVAGFVGGNPATPTQQQGQEAFSNDSGDSGFTMPTLTDTNVMRSTNSGPAKGYVININAQSNKGQEHAQEAIQQAMGQSFSRSNVNIAMNINDQSSNSKNDNNSLLDEIQGALS